MWLSSHVSHSSAIVHITLWLVKPCIVLGELKCYWAVWDGSFLPTFHVLYAAQRVCILSNIDLHVFIDFYCFCYKYFISSWDQIGILQYKRIPTLVRILNSRFCASQFIVNKNPTRCNSMQIFIHCKVTLHVSGVTAPIIRSTKNCNRNVRTGHNTGTATSLQCGLQTTLEGSSCTGGCGYSF